MSVFFFCSFYLHKYKSTIIGINVQLATITNLHTLAGSYITMQATQDLRQEYNTDDGCGTKDQ